MKWFAIFVALMFMLSGASVALAEDVANETPEVEPEITEEVVAEEPATDEVAADESTTDEVVAGEVVADEAEVVLVSEDEVAAEVVETEDVETEEAETPIEGIINETEEEEAGVSPDQPILWGLERALEKLDVLITLNKAAKAQKGLQHAYERHLEVLAMIKEKKLVHAEKAQKAYEETIDEVESNIETDDSEGELSEASDVEAELSAEKARMMKVSIALKAANLTDEQRSAIDALVNRFQEKVQNAKVKVQEKKERIKVKIKAKYEMTDEEVATLENEIKGANAGTTAQIKAKISEIKETRTNAAVKSKVGASETEDEVEIEVEAENETIDAVSKARGRD